MRGLKLTSTLGLATTVALAGAATSVAQDSFPIVVPAYSHPNGGESGDRNAVDDRDYGLRLDTASGAQTFHFEDVSMTFLNPGEAFPDTIMARLEGTIAHLQSSDNGATGYTSGSGLDAEDQRYRIEADFRLIGQSGDWNSADLPNENMLDELLASGNGKLTFSLFDFGLNPLFAPQDQVFDGPLAWDEYPGSDDTPNPGAFFITPRHRLSESVFPGQDWDVLAAAGWAEPSSDAGRSHTNDFLFTLGSPVPEPATASLLALGSLLWIRRR